MEGQISIDSEVIVRKVLHIAGLPLTGMHEELKGYRIQVNVEARNLKDLQKFVETMNNLIKLSRLENPSLARLHRICPFQIDFSTTVSDSSIA